MKNFYKFKKLFLIREFTRYFILTISIFFLSLLISSLFQSKIPILFTASPLILFLKTLLKNNLFFARELEKILKDYDGKIVTAFLYRNEKDPFKIEYSKKIFKEIDNIEIEKLFKFNFKDEKKFFIISLSLFTFFFLLFPNNFVFLLYKSPVLKEKIIYKEPPPYHYTTRNFIYTARIIGKEIKKAKIFYEINGTKKEFVNPVYDGKIVFVYNPEPGTLKFKIKTENDETKLLKTVFIEPPKIVKISAKSEKGEKEIPFLNVKENEKIELQVFLSQKVDLEKIVIGDKKLVLKDVKDYKVNLNFKKDRKIKFIHFIKKDSFTDPQILFVKVLKEYPPFVKILFPLSDTTIPDEMKIPFLVFASDDIGLDYSMLFIEKNGKIIEKKFLKNFKGKKVDTLKTVVDFDPLNPKPGEDFYVFFRIFDRDETKKFSDTRKIKIHMPTFEEIYSKVKSESQKFEENLTPLSHESKEILKELKEIKEKLKERKISRKELRENIKEIEKEIEELTKKIEEIDKKLKKLEENIVSLDPELNEKLQRLSELMNEMFGKELREIIKNLEEAIKRGNKEEIEKRLKELIQKKEEWKENLERTISLLERIKKEFDLKKLVEKSKNLEAKISENLSKRNEEKLKENEKELENILKEAEEIKEGFEEDIKKEIEKGETEGIKALENFEKGNMEKGYKYVRNMRKSFENAQQMMLKKNMKFAKDLIEDAFWGVMGFIKELNEDEKEDFFKNLYISYQKFFEDIFLRSTKTLLFPKEALREMKIAEFIFEEFIDYLKNKEFNQAEETKRALRGALSKAGYLLLNFSQTLSQSGGSEAQFLQNLMKRLSEMAKKQSLINKLTQSIMPLPMQGISEEEKKILEELAREQGELAKEIENLLKELEGRGKELSGLEKTLEGAKKEMKESEESLRKKELTERLRNIQERILSRLLQAQRSVRKREFIKRRYAERPKEYKIEIPEKINFEGYEKILKGKRKLFENGNLLPKDIEKVLKYYEYLESHENE